MHLARVVIRDFRNFERVDVPIGMGVTCLVGENNSGKSNFLHAIRLAADANLPNVWRQLSFDDIHGAPIGGGPHHVLISLEFDGLGQDDEADGFTAEWLISDTRARLTYRFRPRPAIRQKLEDQDITAEALTSDDYGWDLTGGGTFDPLTLDWNDPAGTTGDIFSILQEYRVHHMPPLRDVEEDIRYVRRSPLLRLLRQSSISDEERNEIARIVEVANGQVAEREPLRILGEAISEHQASASGPAFAQRVRLGFGEATFDGVARALIPLLEGPSGRYFAVHRNGLGLNNVLYLSMLLQSFKLERDSKAAAGHLVLCEEPEAHLHPELQVSLMRALRDDGTQALVTTHSTHIAAGAGLASCVALTMRDRGHSSTVSPAAPPSMPPAVVADLDRYLDATRSRLIFARSVVLVEGAAEMLLLPVLAREVLELDLDGSGVCVVPIFGTHFEVFAALFTEGGIEKRCAIIADGDLEPEVGQDEGEPLDADANPYTSLDSAYVRSFVCRKTFERTLPRLGCLLTISNAAGEMRVGRGSRLARQLIASIDTVRSLYDKKDVAWKDLLPDVREQTLRLADAVGKGRFAQIVARHAVGLVKKIPPYIEEALKWVTSNATD